MKSAAADKRGDRREKRRPLLLILADLMALVIVLDLFALFHHVLPHAVGNRYGRTPGGDPATFDFPGRFTDGGIEETGSADGTLRYRDGTLDLTLYKTTFAGSVCTVADFYLKDLARFRTAFAGEDFVTGEAAATVDMARKNGALLAASGDYCGIRQRSVVIRNGLVYRKTKAHEICVLYRSGVMETYSFAAFDADRAVAGGAWQAWDFGPRLLDEKGAARTEFAPGIAGPNPRMLLGYFEPGHYCVVAVDGRQAASPGLTLPECAALMEDLGCSAAYNLDGGHSAVMAWRGETVNTPSKTGGRDISDILYLTGGEGS